MSQAGIVDVESSNPQIPTMFVTNSGTAVPLGNILEILGTTVAAHSIPLRTTGTANIVTIEAQFTSAIAATDPTKVGLAAFNSAQFTVDANGFVTLTGGGGGAVDMIGVDAATAPGTNPVLPTAGGLITITGGQVAAGTTTNVIRTDSLAANRFTIEIQRSQAVAGTTIGANGVAHFNSTFFTVDANGFVSVTGTGLAQTITGNTGGALSPTAGNWNILGTSTAAGSTPVQTAGAVSTLTVQVQKSQAIAGTDATKVGLAAFNSAQFTVDVNGFVSFAGGSGPAIESVTVDAFTAPGTNPVLPTGAGTITVTGSQVAAGTTTNVIRTDSLAANTYTIQIQRSQAVATATIGDNGVSHFNSAQFSVDANGFVSAAGALATTYTENSGTATPSAGNLNILGPNSALTGYSPWTVGSGATATVNMPGTVKWVVNATANLGTHTTIQAAITAASAGDDVFITPGTYTENLTLKAGVNLVAYAADSSLNGTGNVIINGTCTLTTAGTVSLSGIQLQTNSAAFLAVTGSAASIVNLTNCYLNASNSQGITFSSSSSSAQINVNNCSGNVGSNTKFFDISGAGTLFFQYCNFTNSGVATTASTASAGVLAFKSSQILSPITTSGTNLFASFQTNFNAQPLNVTPLTLGGSGTNNSSFDYYNGGTATAISVGSNLLLSLPTVTSSNTATISGAGTLRYSGVSFLSNSTSNITVTTQIGGVLSGGQFQAPSAGFIGEQLFAQLALASAISISNNTAKTIISLTLTPGIWDVTGIGAIRGSATGTLWSIGISTTTNVATTNYGYDNVSTPILSTTSTDSTLVVPKLRLTLTASTTYYLVAFALFTVGTPVMYGTLNATRVG